MSKHRRSPSADVEKVDRVAHMPICRALTCRRLSMDMRLEDVAKIVGCSGAHISNIEGGLRYIHPEDELTQKLFAALNLPIPEPKEIRLHNDESWKLQIESGRVKEGSRPEHYRRH